MIMKVKQRSVQTCGNCRWSRFRMTKHEPPRPRPQRTGECLWPVPELPVLPQCIEGYDLNRRAIWPEMTDCPVWEKKQGK